MCCARICAWNLLASLPCNDSGDNSKIKIYLEIIAYLQACVALTGVVTNQKHLSFIVIRNTLALHCFLSAWRLCGAESLEFSSASFVAGGKRRQFSNQKLSFVVSVVVAKLRIYDGAHIVSYNNNACQLAAYSMSSCCWRVERENMEYGVWSVAENLRAVLWFTIKSKSYFLQ